MSEHLRAANGALSLPKRQPGSDETWDRLGEGWQAIDGAVDGTRIYAKWATDAEGRSELAGICIEAGPITGETLRSIPVGRLARVPDAEPIALSQLAPLHRGGRPPAEFAKDVAYYYKVFNQITPHPAKAMAEHSHVPVSTMRGWIHEARLRGELPPGTRGRAG